MKALVLKDVDLLEAGGVGKLRERCLKGARPSAAGRARRDRSSADATWRPVVLLRDPDGAGVQAVQDMHRQCVGRSSLCRGGNACSLKHPALTAL